MFVKLQVVLLAIMAAAFIAACSDDDDAAQSSNATSSAASSSSAGPVAWLTSCPRIDKVNLSSVVLKVGIEAWGKVYCLVRNAGVGEPLPEDVRSGDARGGTTVEGGAEIFLEITELVQNTDYDLWLVAADTAGKLQTSCFKLPIRTSTDEAKWISGYPRLLSTAPNSAQFSFMLDRWGRVYAISRLKSAAAPSVVDVRNGDTGGGVVVAANQEVSLNLPSLLEDEAHSVYFVAEDTDGNLQSVPTKVDCVTPQAEPVIECATVPAQAAGAVFAAGHTGLIYQTPARSISGLKSFRMGKYEISEAVINSIAGWANTHGYSLSATTALTPYIVRYHPQAFVLCNAISEKKGRRPVYYKDAALTQVVRDVSGAWFSPYKDSTANGYRLPTLDQWEYAARYIDGTSYIAWNGYSGDVSGTQRDTYAWTAYNNTGIPVHDVGLKLPNSLGLYDMSGNVYEWTQDEWFVGGCGAYADSVITGELGIYGSPEQGWDQELLDMLGFRVIRYQAL